MRFSLVAAAVVLLAAAVEAQKPIPPRRPTTARPPTGQRVMRPAGDTGNTQADSARRQRETLVEWAPPDSVLQELLDREDYAVTRYKGDSVVFEATSKELQLRGDAAVQRSQSLLVSDTIIYNDSSKVVIATGDTITLRDPSQQEADLIARGRLVYDLEGRKALASNVSTAVTAGETWFVEGEKTAPLLADSATGQEASFYARNGEISSCDLPADLRHYHFSAREIKVVNKKSLVARPAVLYIADVPVMWLPFIYKSLQSGRQSGILTPRFGISEIVRNSPTYRRHIENLGYYWAINEYMDAQVAIDWRSGSRPSLGDPGWMRLTGEWQYRWLDRFLSGRIGGSHHAQRDGSTNTAFSWQHQQKFSEQRTLTANLNYATNTTVQRTTTVNPIAAFAVIGSQLTYQHDFSRVSTNFGGTRKQYPGRQQVDQDFPSFSISTKGPINIGPHLVWTPSLSFANSESFKIDQAGTFAYRLFRRDDGALDSSKVERNSRQTRVAVGTPLQLFGFRLDNSFNVTDALNDFPDTRVVYGPNGERQTRVYARTYATRVDWRTSFSLPTLFQGSWNLSPSVSLENVDPNGYWVRTEITGDKFVRGEKRLTYGASVSPTLYALLPGFGPVSRFRHSISPSIGYAFAPAKSVSDEYLRANGRDPSSFLGALRQNQVSLGFSTNLEAKMRSAADTSAETPESGQKVKVLSLNFDALSYDFERERKTGRGFTTDRFGYGARSDLLPGVDVRVGYSLFQGDPMSDTAVFKPYRESVSANFTMNRRSNPIVLLSRILGKAVPMGTPAVEHVEQGSDDAMAQQLAHQPAAGIVRNAQMVIPQGQGWQMNVTYSLQRPRPPTGANVIDFDPRAICDDPLFTGFQRNACRLNAPTTNDGSLGFQTSLGAPLYRQPPQQTVQTSLSFDVTPRWTAQWSTTYDFEEVQFASHSVQLQRELHDWRAIFSFVQAPNGNFAFSFFIALKAEPDLKFDYNRQTYRRPQ